MKSRFGELLCPREGDPVQGGLARLPPAQQREDASRALRKDVTRLQEMLLNAPVKAIEDIAKRSWLAIEQQREKIEEPLREKHAQWMKMRENNKRQLKPQLSNPNFAQQLLDLCDTEANRTAATQTATRGSARTLRVVRGLGSAPRA